VFTETKSKHAIGKGIYLKVNIQNINSHVQCPPDIPNYLFRLVLMEIRVLAVLGNL
jgi:hypothetical protein